MNFALDPLTEYDLTVFRLGRWAMDAVVTLLALYGLAFVPLGKQTGLEHLRDILTTREAKEAGAGLLEAAHRLRKRLLADLDPIDTPGAPVLPELALGAPGAPALASGAGESEQHSEAENRLEGRISDD